MRPHLLPAGGGGDGEPVQDQLRPRPRIEEVQHAAQSARTGAETAAQTAREESEKAAQSAWLETQAAAQAARESVEEAAQAAREATGAAAQNAAERAAIAFAGEFAKGGQVTDATFAEARKHLSEREITDLALVCGYFIALGFSVNAFQVDLEADRKPLMKPVA